MTIDNNEFVWAIIDSCDGWPTAYCESEVEAAMICAEYNDSHDSEPDSDTYQQCLTYRKLRRGHASMPYVLGNVGKDLYRIITAYAEFESPGVYNIECKDLRRGQEFQRWTFNYQPPKVEVYGFDDGENDTNYCIQVCAGSYETDDEVHQKIAEALRDHLKAKGVPLADE